MLQKIKSILFIVILSCMSTIILLSFDSKTKAKIKANNEFILKKTVLELCDFKPTKENYDALFEQNIKRIKIKDKDAYINSNGNYILQFDGIGLWGKLKGLVLLNKDMKTIENICIISQDETPGIGSKIADDKYLAKYKKTVLEPELKLCTRKKATEKNEIDAISGATFSSSALLKTINNTIKSVRG